MSFGLPNISYIGYPVSIPCAGHAGLGLREALRADAPAVLAHLRALGPADRRMRFCGTVGDGQLERHVASLWDRCAFALTAQDGPLWSTALGPAGPVRALAEVAISGTGAEIGISVDTSLRRRGVGTYLTQTVGRLLAQRNVATLTAYTMSDNRSMIQLGRTCDARIDTSDGEIEIVFSVASLRHAYLRRRLRPAPVFARAG